MEQFQHGMKLARIARLLAYKSNAERYPFDTNFTDLMKSCLSEEEEKSIQRQILHNLGAKELTQALYNNESGWFDVKHRSLRLYPLDDPNVLELLLCSIGFLFEKNQISCLPHVIPILIEDGNHDHCHYHHYCYRYHFISLHITSHHFI